MTKPVVPPAPDYQAIGDVLFRVLPEGTGNVLLLFEDSASKLHCVSNVIGVDLTRALIRRLLQQVEAPGGFAVYRTTDLNG